MVSVLVLPGAAVGGIQMSVCCMLHVWAGLIAIGFMG